MQRPGGQHWPLKLKINMTVLILRRRYDSLASYTIFSQVSLRVTLTWRKKGEPSSAQPPPAALQADPFPHNEFFLEMLKRPAMLGKVQTMSRLYLASGSFETPKEAGE